MNLRARGVGIAVESAILYAVFLLANLLRFGGSLHQLWAYENLFVKALLCTAVVQICLFYGELYEFRAFRRRLELFLRVGQCLVLATVVLTVVFFAAPDLKVGRVMYAIYIPLAWSALIAWRHVLLWSWSGETLGERVLVLGTGISARQIAREILQRAPLGYRVLGFLTEHPQEVGRVLVNPSVIGTLDELPRLVRERNATLIVVAQEDRRRRLPVDSLLRCRLAGVRVVEATSLFEDMSGRILVRDLRPSWLIFSGGFSKPRFLQSAKQAIETVLAATLLAFLAPLLALIALLVRLGSRGPVLYRQERVGKGGRIFTLLKFRTMREDAESASGPVWAAEEDDPRITLLGRLLRKTRLDELPQLWNVFRGDMSFVGPRPERPHFVEKLRKVIPYYDERHGVKPGITGWAQVKFPYGSTLEDAEEKLEYDLFYVKHMSPLLDLAIMLATAKVMLIGRGAR